MRGESTDSKYRQRFLSVSLEVQSVQFNSVQFSHSHVQLFATP